MTETTLHRHDLLAASLHVRTGYALPPPVTVGQLAIPTGISLEARLTEEESVVLALWNNAGFQELLVELDLMRADAVHAAQLPNPELWLLSPIGVKQLEFALEWPVDTLWLRPRRMRVAEQDAVRVAEILVQAALDLIRDVHVAYADAMLADERVQIARDAEALRRRIADLTEARLQAGDATPVESATARIEARRADQDVKRLEYDRALALDRLQHLLGLRAVRPEFNLVEPPAAELSTSVDDLVEEALISRPDVQAADRAIAAAQERQRLSRCEWFKLLGIADANGQGKKGFEIGPGVRLTIPIFNQNQGRIERAEAEVERAVRQHATLQTRVVLEVRRAHLQLAQARSDLERSQKEIYPAVADIIRKAENAYKEGDLPLVAVLESARQLLDVQNREAQLRAEVRHATAELERSVGHRLTAVTSPIHSRERCSP